MSKRAKVLATAIMAMPAAAYGQAAPSRIALVVGESAYPGQPLATAANDAGLVASTLQQAGYDVVGARDLGRDDLRRSIDDFVARAMTSPPGTEAFVYFSGYGVQYAGADYVAPVDASLSNAQDVPNEAVAIGLMTDALSRTSLGSITVVMDASKRGGFPLAGLPVAGGLAMEHPAPRTTMAFDAAPGTVTPDWQGSYGPYAGALAETLREGGLTIPAIFRRVRIKVAYATDGDQVPWNWSQSMPNVPFLETASDATVDGASFAEYEARPVSFGTSSDGYALAVARDSLSDYDAFLAAFPDSPEAPRVRAMAAVRREAIAWRGVADVATRAAFEAYVYRYPRGPHVGDASRGLMGVGPRQEAEFAGATFLLESPPAYDLSLVVGPAVGLGDPGMGLAPPPPKPDWEPFSYDPTAAYLTNAPTVAAGALLPLPLLVALPAYVRVRGRDTAREGRPVPMPRGLSTGTARPAYPTVPAIVQGQSRERPSPTAMRPEDVRGNARPSVEPGAVDPRARTARPRHVEAAPSATTQAGRERTASPPPTLPREGAVSAPLPAPTAIVPATRPDLVAAPRAVERGTETPVGETPRVASTRQVERAPASRAVAPVEYARPSYAAPTYAVPSPAYAVQPRQTYVAPVVQRPQSVPQPQVRDVAPAAQEQAEIVQRQYIPQPQAIPERPLQFQQQQMGQPGGFRGR